MKQIKLGGKNLFALVDDADYDFLMQWNWCAKRDCNTYYVYRVRQRGEEGATQILMHRVILNTPKGVFVDHKDHNGLNNQRENIRHCTASQNTMNVTTHSKTGYLGVSYYDFNRKKSKPYRATIWIDGGNIHLGTFATKEEAAIAYNKAALEHHGEFANLNIIPDQSTFS